MLVASVAVLLVIPLLLGILFEFVVVIPLRVPLDQTALLYIWQVREMTVDFPRGVILYTDTLRELLDKI